MNLPPECIVSGHFFIMIYKIFIRYRLKGFRCPALASMYQFTVFPVYNPWKCRCLPFFYCFYQLQYRLVPFSQQDIITVFYRFPVVHGSVETSHHNNGMTLLFEISGQLITSYCTERKNTDHYHICIQNIVHNKSGNRLAVHQGIFYLLFHNRGQCIQSYRRRPDISVIYKMV